MNELVRRNRTISQFLLALGIIFALTHTLIAPTSTFSQDTIPFFQAGKIRVLIFSGRNNHDWRSTTPFLRKILVGSGRFDVRVEEEPSGVTAETLAAYDVLVLDYQGPRWGEVTENAVVNFVKQGKGLVAVHAANYAFTGLEVLADNHKPSGLKQPAWPEYLQMIGGWWTEGPPKTAHAPRHCFTVKFVDRAHPVTKGLPESFRVSDELYHNPKMSPDAHILATAYDDPANGGTGKDEPMLWTVNYGQGRVLYTALGHDVAAQQESGFVSTFARGVEWAATGAVTLSAAGSLPSQAPSPLRVLVVTGGHPYATTFYSVFEGWDDVHWDHALSNHEAYRGDLRKQYDVLVLYDFTQEITDTEKTNLQNFVEAGKGIVVLHHAIADYQNWEWWYKEVVGGKYLMKPDGSMPASTYKDHQEACIRVETRHPVTAGIGAMHLWDETYHGMWISPDVKVLLRSDAATSDGPVAWISPYPKSRVVYIQLGHGETAHLYPAYRVLVHNAIVWTGGR
jgi:type 1 glutamine amidotransferase